MRPGLKLLIALTALAGAAQAQQSVYTAPATHSVAEADAKLAQVAKARAAIENDYAASERECNTKFFVNNCLDKAKEKRRAALATQRAIEVEAQHFKRADSVAKRDADLAERARKDAEEQALRDAQPAKPPHEEKAPPPAPTGMRVAEREAQHDAKVKREQQQEAADVAKRAANVQAYERKKAESAKRQAEVARKKAENEEKARKAAERAEADRQKAEAAAARKQ